MQRLTTKLLGMIAVAVALLFFGAAPTLAQITVSLPNTAGPAGASGTIPVSVEDNLTGEGVLAYDFTVTVDPSVIQIIDYDASGTLSEGMTINSTTTATSIRIVAASASALEGSGTLIKLVADFQAVGDSNLEFAEFTFNEGDPVADPQDGTVTVPDIAFILPHLTVGGGGEISIPVTTQDLTGEGVLSYDFTVEFDPTVVTLTGIDVSGTISEDMTVNSTTTANSIRVVGASASELSGSGVVVNLTGTVSDDEGSTILDFTNVTLNEGDPSGGGLDGSLSVGGNLAPTFTSSLPDTTIAEGQMLTFDYDAEDPEGEDVTYSIVQGPDGATIDAATGVLTWTPAFDAAGDVTLVVGANDGSVTGTATATVTVTDVTANFVANLSSLNEVPPVLGAGSGSAQINLDGNSVTVTGSFSNLVAGYAASHIHVGPTGVSGPVVVPLVADVSDDGRSGTFEEGDNTFDLGALTYPDGIDADSVRAALQNGNAYVNVHTSAYPGGELRGQILGVGNNPPSASEITEPADGADYTIEGDPEDILFTVQTSTATDPDGDEVSYLIQASTESSFPVHLTASNLFEGPPGGVILVGMAARVFDVANGGEPGTIAPGTVDDVYIRVITTDGSLWTAGPRTQVTLTRGLVTSDENPAELPGEFALRGNYPNPFNPSTTVRFDLPVTASVSIEVYDILGRQVMALPAETMPAGSDRSIDIDASALTSGTYVYRIVAESTSDTMVKSGKMTLIK